MSIDDDLIVGAFDVGAYGPTLVMKLKSTGAARFLIDLFSLAARGETPLLLVPRAGVRIRGVESLELQRSPRRELKRLMRDDRNRFIWRCTPDEWQFTIWLLQPFLEDKPGHQYLTSELDDDALIEVSLHEPLLGL